MIDEPNNLTDQPQEQPESAVEDVAVQAKVPVASGVEPPAVLDAPDPSAAEVADGPPVEAIASSEPLTSQPPTDFVAPQEQSESEVVEQEEPLEDVEPLEMIEPDTAEDIEKDGYILKVQSNREESIADALRRRVKVEGLDQYFDEVVVPTEDVAEFKGGKKKIVKRKLYPGYIVVKMAICDETWFLVRETPGIGDFTGSAGKPTPMLPHEVERILRTSMPDEAGGAQVKTAIPFKHDDRVRIKEGTFENFEGDVDEIDEANGRVTVMINIFGRSTPVELEHWQIESI